MCFIQLEATSLILAVVRVEPVVKYRLSHGSVMFSSFFQKAANPS
jgi:hypothetical protein